MGNGTVKPRARKVSTPAKPHRDFPLFPHASGRWAKKVKGQFCYFGKTADDPTGETALALWLDQKDDLLAGRKPRANQKGLDLRELANRFLTAKRSRLDSGELGQRSFAELYATCDRLLRALGKTRLVDDLRPDDFEALRAAWSKLWGPHRLGGEIGRTRSLFRYAVDEGLIDKPVMFGKGFAKPSAKTMRQHRAAQTRANGKRMFDAAELRKIIDAAGVPLKAMILLGINTGLGAADCSEMPQSALNLESAILDFPRPKTGIDRRAFLWPETIEAIRDALAVQPTPKDADAADAVFVTKYGLRWVRSYDNCVNDDAVGKEFNKLLKQLGLKRPGLSFYGLRHTYRTVADSARDPVAIGLTMGHVDSSVAGLYREHVDDERLEAVAKHVQAWLFGPKGKKA